MRNDHLFAALSAVSLAGLEERASLLARQDNKYIVDTRGLIRLVDGLAGGFDALEIQGRRTFLYDTRYFDEPSLRTFHDHRQGRRRRFKLRTRHYVDAGRCFMELKVKSYRGMTVKERTPIPVARAGTLDRNVRAFASDALTRHAGLDLPEPLTLQLAMRYSRTTLVSRDGGERLTIDQGMQFDAGDHVFTAPPDRWIIEVKTEHGRGAADRLLQMLGHRPANRCSKYCIGLAVTGRVDRANRFLSTLRRLGCPSDTGRATAPSASCPWSIAS